MDGIIFWAAVLDTRKLRFVMFFFPSLQPCLEVSPLFVLVVATETRRVCVLVCMFVCLHIYIYAFPSFYCHFTIFEP